MEKATKFKEKHPKTLPENFPGYDPGRHHLCMGQSKTDVYN